MLVVDNESDDNSLEIIKAFACRLITIPRKDFTYGGALNTGISHCNGKYILICSPHICLRNNDFLQKTIQYLDNDHNAAGLRFIQAGQTIQKIACDKEYNTLKYNTTADFFNKNNTHFIVNHCSAIRKKCWKLLPFDDKIIICEDKKWSMQILQQGYHILYHIPLLYTYEKTLYHDEKRWKHARELAANEMISGHIHPLYKDGYSTSLFSIIKTELWRVKRRIAEHRKIYKMLKTARRLK